MVILKGNLVIEGVVVKIIGVKNLEIIGLVRVFDLEEVCLEVILVGKI